MDSVKLLCHDIGIKPLTRIPRALEPLHGLYMLYQMAEDGISEGNNVNILAINLNRDVFFWENAELLEIDGPQIVFAPDKTKQKECEGDILSLLLDRVILIQNT